MSDSRVANAWTFVRVPTRRIRWATFSVGVYRLLTEAAGPGLRQPGPRPGTRRRHRGRFHTGFNEPRAQVAGCAFVTRNAQRAADEKSKISNTQGPESREISQSTGRALRIRDAKRAARPVR